MTSMFKAGKARKAVQHVSKGVRLPMRNQCATHADTDIKKAERVFEHGAWASVHESRMRLST